MVTASARCARSNGIDASLASLEDLLIAKLEWSKLGDSELQKRDVIELLERAWHRLDLEYVERWLGQLHSRSEWEAVRARATLPPE